jgi:S-adenosylmethionine-dependent methyltransferase
MSELSKNYIPYTEEAQVRIKDALVTHYFSGNVEGKQDDLQDHLTRSVEINRNTIIPWIDAHYKLHGSKLLEIGSGTGCSTLAYSEQGAEVTGVDILESSIKVAEVRCNAYGYYPNFIIGNATTIDAMLPEKKFGIAVFHASLEHMILEERIDSLKAVWEKIDKGGILVIVEAPNRLWHTDNHTSLLPFFHWLPDDLAFEYAKYSSRKGFGDIYDNWEKQKLHFLRRGRGVSFHEFEMTFGNFKNIRS